MIKQIYIINTIITINMQHDTICCVYTFMKNLDIGATVQRKFTYQKRISCL